MLARAFTNKKTTELVSCISKVYLALITLTNAVIFSPLTLAAVNNQLITETEVSVSALNNETEVSPIEVIEVTNSGFNSLNHHIIDREEFIDSAQTLADVVNTVSGIQILSQGGVGSPVTVSIRGSNSQQVQLYIDGQLMNDGQFGGFDLNQIPTEHIETIEISKNQAVGTGSTPIGGVIKITTYDASESNSKINGAIGSFGYQELNTTVNHIIKNNHLSFGFNYLASDNDYDYWVPQPENSPNQSVKQPIANNFFSKKSFFVNNNTDWTNHQLRVNLHYGEQEKGLLSYQRNDQKNKSIITADTLRFGTIYKWSVYWQALEHIEFSLNHENKEEYYADRREGTTGVTADYQTIKNHLSIQPQLLYTANKHTIKLVPYVTYSKQEFSSDSLFEGQETECGISICDVKAEQTQLHLGSRIELNIDNSPFNAYVLFNQLQEDNSNLAIKDANAVSLNKSATHNTKEIGIQYATKQFKSQFNISDAQRTPTLFELFGNRGLVKGNDELKAELAKNYSLNAQYFFNDFTFNGAIYQNNLKNSIIASYGSDGIGRYGNVDESRVRGLELQLDWEISTKSSLSAQSNFIDSEITASSVKSYLNKFLPGIYHQQYSFAYQYAWNDSWQFKVNTNFDSGLYFNRSNIIENNGDPADRYTTDININWQHKNYSINLSVNNLFDEHYQDIANRPAPGTNIFCKFSIRGI